MRYVFTDELMGLGPPAVVDSVRKAALGQIMHAIDADGGLGGAEFIYLQGATGMAPGTLVSWDPVNNVTTINPNTSANSGQPLAVALSNAGPGQYGWFQIYGAATVRKDGTALTAGGTIGIGTAPGTVGAATAGKQIMNARAINAAAAGVTTATVLLNRQFAEGQIT